MYICAECYGGPEHVGGNQLKGKEKKKSIQKICVVVIRSKKIGRAHV